jgi:CBS domain-containing protein
MQAQDIMTTAVIAVKPDTSVTEVARTRLAHNIGAVPVMENGDVLGIVSESDLLRRPETGTIRRRGWLSYFDDPALLAEEYARLHGTKARDVMTEQVQSVAPDADLIDVVDLMERDHIRRVLVMEGKAVRGVICRSDLLRGLLSAREAATATETDRGIRAMLLDEIRDQPWRTLADRDIAVKNGTVTFAGPRTSEEEREALRVAAESIAGVVGVSDRTLGPLPVSVPLI